MTTYRELIEYASELGERFPDLTDSQVIDSCEEYVGMDRPFSIGRKSIALQAYEFGKNTATYDDVRWWGYDLDEEVERADHH